MRPYHFPVVCFWCKKEFNQRIDTIKRQQINYAHTCCRQCFGKEPSFRERRKQIMLTNNPFKGKKHSDEILKHLSLFKKGQKAWNKGLNEHNNASVKKHADAMREHCKRRNWTQENNPNWRGGSSVFNKDNTFFTKWVPFRNGILERDNRTCWKCNETSKNLHVHHLVSKSKVPSLKYDELNCIVLCKKCHNEFHSQFGIINFNYSDCIKWINKEREKHNHLQMC